jgi:CHAT domain-containing protein
MASAANAGAAQIVPRFRYVLFSTHGLADTQNGMLSCVALSTPSADSTEDGYLQAQEVMDLELDTDLVMLSACQTGLGRLRGGEGLIGLSAAFFYAGAESTCASLWQVPSGPTSQLVTEFFRRLKEGNVSRAEALRQAQLTVMRQGRTPDGQSTDYSSPFCWAAFVLMGEYENHIDR